MREVKLAALSCVCADWFPEREEIRPGGEALNFAIAASREPHVRSHLVGAIGTDEIARVIVRKLSETAVDTTCLQTIPGPTASNRIYLTDSGDRYFKPDSWTSGVFGAYHPDAEARALLSRMDAVQVTFSCPAARDMLALKPTASFLLSMDFDDARDFDAWEPLLPLLDVFFISGEASILPRLATWSQRYPAVFVATLAEKGSAAFHRGQAYRAEAVPVQQIVDTTGCGDCYQAGFMACYTRRRDIQLALENGSEAAAKNLMRLGGC